jgi:putative polyketide hydroxylase
MRAPHLAVEREGASSSLLDLYGGGFVVLGADGWREGAGRVAEKLGIPLETHRPGEDFRDASSTFGELYGVGDEGATLVRPDGFVAWRTQRSPEDGEDALARALAAAIGR